MIKSLYIFPFKSARGHPVSLSVSVSSPRLPGVFLFLRLPRPHDGRDQRQRIPTDQRQHRRLLLVQDKATDHPGGGRCGERRPPGQDTRLRGDPREQGRGQEEEPDLPHPVSHFYFFKRTQVQLERTANRRLRLWRRGRLGDAPSLTPFQASRAFSKYLEEDNVRLTMIDDGLYNERLCTSASSFWKNNPVPDRTDRVGMERPDWKELF